VKERHEISTGVNGISEIMKNQSENEMAKAKAYGVSSAWRAKYQRNSSSSISIEGVMA